MSNGDVEIIVVVSYVDERSLTRLAVIDGIDLMEVVHHRRLRPSGIVEDAIECRRGIRSSDSERLLILGEPDLTAILGGGVRYSQERDDERQTSNKLHSGH